ncbi:F0F1 ATP synthase subunit epsilon [Pelagibacterales bacterium]|nr:F0F1 ATP synthase subunit epsilon [Pelagibacterales bacterium]
MSEIFSIKLVTPSKVFLEANASLVTVPATEGDIGFLANHVNFISSIRLGFISVNLESGDEKVIYISEGFAQFNDNSLLIIAVELIEKEDLNSDFVNQKIIDLQNMQVSNISNIKLQSKIDSLKSLSL